MEAESMQLKSGLSLVWRSGAFWLFWQQRLEQSGSGPSLDGHSSLDLPLILEPHYLLMLMLLSV